MRIDTDISALGRTKWYEYLVRFAIGGAVTVVAALVAKRFGPGIGGLFLAFPAIFPATATLINSHEKKKKARLGLNGTQRARELAGADAIGASMGAIALIVFAGVVWRTVTDHSTVLTLSTATLAWLFVAFFIWQATQTVKRYRHSSASHGAPPDAATHTNRRSL